MAHEIDFTTGRPAIAYTNETPWHGFGEAMPENQPLDVWRVAAGLNWQVDEDPIYRDRPPAHKSYGVEQIPNRKVLSRSDTGGILSVVSNRYKVVQPGQIISFFKRLIDELGFKMSTAGSLRDGKRVWAMADCGKDFHVNQDRVEAHLLLATAYDGSFSTTGMFTSIRAVCNNTLQANLDSAQGMIKIPHTQNFDAYEVQADLGLNSQWINFRENVFKLSEHKVTKREALEYFLTVMGVTEDEAADGKQLFNVKKLLSIYESGPGSQLPSAKDTAWGLINAVTYFTDHGRRAKNNGNRFDSASFGSGAALKRDAFKEAIRIAA